MPLQATSGAASYDAFGGGVPFVPTYIEDVMSVWLYAGTSATQTITNGIDLAGKGGLVWAKDRTAANSHQLYDTVRGVQKRLITDQTAAQGTETSGITAFNSNGWTMGAQYEINGSGSNYVSWTFRKQPKFFDVVTYTGNGASFKIINHSLGSAPGFVVIKRTDAAGDWYCARRDASQNWTTGRLNSTAAMTLYYDDDGVDATTQINVNRVVDAVGAATTVNISGATYVAYLFAHNAGGFGLTGTDNVITCGSMTVDGSGNATVNLGYEPQWVMLKRSDGGAESWLMLDVMRGWAYTGTAYLLANLSSAEGNYGATDIGTPTATGFTAHYFTAGATYIYIAIRRGPMKVPTTGTSVFGLNARTGTGANATVTGSAGVSDAVLIKNRGSAVGDLFASRLTGTGYLETSSTAAEVAAGTTILQANPWDVMDGVKVGTTSTITNASANTYINYLFDRAPGFFDEVCYTGDAGFSANYAHNLTVQPELVISKRRNSTNNWAVAVRIGNNSWVTSNATGGFVLNSTASTVQVTGYDAFFTPTHFGPGYIGGGWESSNILGATYVAYLFASAPGVSKVFSYTGNGSSQTINCGFTGGARFVMVKRTDSTGNWMVVDTARGLVSAGDPTLYLNSTAAEVTGVDWIDPDSSGFIVNQEGTMNANVSSATYIGLAIA
jgi:hypothetical protein